MNRPLCFVLMPFGRKPDAAGAIIDFDAVYGELIAPAIRQADMEPLRADEELAGGIIHKPMFERLILCDYAVADLTTANANVFYELGVRHAVRPWSTVPVFAGTGRLPFDVAPLRALPYKLTPGGTPEDTEATTTALAQRLDDARHAATDSPIFQLLDWVKGPEVDHAKADVFREQVRYATQAKDRLAAARKVGRDAVSAVELDLGPIENLEAGVVVDLLLSYRATEAFREMVALVEKLETEAPPLAGTVLVREQFAFALNRDQQGDRAERVLLDLLEQRGASSETYGILGRVYKDRWLAAVEAGNDFEARGLLDKAIAAYRRGFEADWRDAYPGVNAVTLMEVREPPDPHRLEVLPVVAYAVERRIAAGKPDYWDYATRLELAVLSDDEGRAATALGDALAAIREVWEPKSTLGNLRVIREARERRGAAAAWLAQVEEALDRKAAQLGVTVDGAT